MELAPSLPSPSRGEGITFLKRAKIILDTLRVSTTPLPPLRGRVGREVQIARAILILGSNKR